MDIYKEVAEGILTEDCAITDKQWPYEGTHIRKRKVAVYADTNGMPVEVKRLTLRMKHKDAMFVSWPMTTKSANSLVRTLQEILNQDLSVDAKVYTIWKLSVTNSYVEWV